MIRTIKNFAVSWVTITKVNNGQILVSIKRSVFLEMLVIKIINKYEQNLTMTLELPLV